MITEWAPGAELCAQFLANWQTCEMFAEKLVRMCLYYRFDGWLLNIENEIQPGEQMVNLIYFITYLTKEMRRALPHGKVIWYDSVITSGELKWQNELNENNKVFFDSSDGIFLNYSWTKENLKNSSVVAAANNRVQDVYVGIDVFGRNQYAGGGFNTNIALDVVREFNLSTAIFAPGWVYERLGKEKFQAHNNLFWSLIAPICHTHVVQRKVLHTSFCQGFGKQLYDRGTVLSSEQWYNLARQYPQPIWDLPDDGHPTINLCIHDGFNGGSCLQVSGFTVNNVAQVELFNKLSLHCTPPVLVSYMLKPITMDGLCLSLMVISETSSGTVIYEFNYSPSSNVEPPSSASSRRVPRNTATGTLRTVRYFSEDSSSSTQSGQQNGWDSMLYMIEEDMGIIKQVKMLIWNHDHKSVPFSFLLGELKICSSDDMTMPPAVSVYRVSDVQVTGDNANQSSADTNTGVVKKVSATIHWVYPKAEALYFVMHQRFDGGSSFKYLCRVHRHMYRISGLEVPSDTEIIEVLAQPVSEAGASVPLAECEFVKIGVL